MTPIRTMQYKKGSFALYIILIIVIIAMMITLKHCNWTGGASHMSENNNDTIDIAIEYSPLSLYTYDDTLGGFSYDFMRLVETVSKHKFVFHPIVSLENTLDGIDKGKYDMAIAQYPATKENRNKYLFSEALYLDRQVLIQLKDSSNIVAIKSQLDLANDTVYVVKDSPMRSRLANLSHEIGDTIYVVEDNNYGPEQLFLLVATGEIKYAVINETIASELSERYPAVDYNTKISFTQFQPVILSQSDSILCDSLNGWIKRAKLLPQFKSLQSRYF